MIRKWPTTSIVVIERRRTNSNKWRKYPADVLPLWVADMDFPSPEPVVRALRERVEHGVFGYGFEGPEFGEVFVDRRAEALRLDDLAGGAGADPRGDSRASTWPAARSTAPGDGLLMQLPVYPPILRAATNHGLTRDGAPLGARADGRYVADLDAFRRGDPSAHARFLLCNPHNPVGRVFTREELAGHGPDLPRRDIPIVADEIHCDLLFAGQRHVPIASLAPEIERRTITLMAPSKTFNLAGLKVSVAVIPDAALRERFVAARGDSCRRGEHLGYTAALAAYRDGQPWLDELMRYLEATATSSVDYVRRHLPGVSMAAPEGTYLAWLDCRNAGSGRGRPVHVLPRAARRWR